MSIIAIIIVLVLIGFVLWLVNTYVPMAPGFKKAVNVVALIAVVLWLLNVFGILGYLSEARI